MKLSVRRRLAFLAWSPFLLMATNCTSQGEGERCNYEHGSLDCEEGLTCKQVFVNALHYICCPVPPARVNVQACNAASGPPAGSSDGGITARDAARDTRTDADADTSPPDQNGNDAVEEPTVDRSVVDTVDVSRDLSIDPSMSDISADRTGADAQDAPSDVPSTPDQTSDAIDDGPPVDGPVPDTVPDVPADVASEASPDAPDLDVLAPIDVDAADVPVEVGPG
jgi:hypothetical protein